MTRAPTRFPVILQSADFAHSWNPSRHVNAGAIQVQAVKGRVPERTALPNATLPSPQAIDCYGRLDVTGHSCPA